MAPLGRLMLIAGACDPQAFLAVAFNAGKDIQQAQNVGGGRSLLFRYRFFGGIKQQPEREHAPGASVLVSVGAHGAQRVAAVSWEL